MGCFYNVYISLYKIYDNSNNINIYNVVRRENINWTQHYFYKRPAFYTPAVGILTSSHTNTTEKVNIHIKLRFTGHVHIHSQHSLSTTQKIHIYTSSAYLCIQMIDRSHDNIHT